ncbi:unnamed protein product [Rhizophagus irregularis]|nr:unnamed protein product [Rhizophagus irregularis]
MYECANSIVRLKPAFNYILENSKSEISNTAVLTILQKRGIFDDIQKLSEVLLPIKDAILSLERNNTNLADCYINLLRVAASIKKMDQYDYKGFHTHMVQVFNKRYEEFNDPKYLLAFFLHPEWKGTLVTPSEFDNLIELAGELWKEWGHKKNSTAELYSQIGKYRLGKKPYNRPYSSKHDTPLNWWLLINDGKNQLSRLAIKLFSITPHSASCERIFSSLGWFFGKRRQRLQLNTLQSMAKIHRYSLSHMKTSVGHVSGTYDGEELRDLLFERNNESEDTDDDIFDEATINQDMARARELERAINYDYELENDDLTIERSVDLGPWVIIEVGQTPVLTHKSDSSDDDDCEDFDPKELANDYRIDMEDSEDTNENNGNNRNNNENNENSGNDESNKEDEDNRWDDNDDENDGDDGDDRDNEDNEDDKEDNEDNEDNENNENNGDDEIFRLLACV